MVKLDIKVAGSAAIIVNTVGYGAKRCSVA